MDSKLDSQVRSPFLTAPDGTELQLRDYGGESPLVLFLHGLAGYAGEWNEVVSAMPPQLRKTAFDQRGHGRSARRPADVSRSACVADVVAVARHYSSDSDPVDLVGQSLGGHTALLTAARHPQIVSRLVLVEASPQGSTPSGLERVRGWLAGWPRPLGSIEEANKLFGAAAPRWLAGMERSANGWRPRFDDDVILATLEAAAGSWWTEWESIVCPTLLVRGERGWISDAEVARMEQTGPCARVEQVAGAGHDVHLDAPAQLARCVSSFLA